MTPPLTGRRLLGGALAPALAAGLLVTVPTPAAYADVSDCAQIIDPGTEAGDDPDPSLPAAQLRIADVHEELLDSGVRPGGGVTVAVVSNGVRDGVVPAVEGVAPVNTATTGPPSHYQGTAAAGVIAGPAYDGGIVGLAPAARVRDVRVFDQPAAGDSEALGPDPQRLVVGLQRLLDQPPDIVVVPMVVERRTRGLTDVIAGLVERDVIVVAAGGDVPAEGEPLWDEFGEDDDGEGPEPGQDAARSAWPAGYEDVVAVGTTVADGGPGDVMLPNSAVDIAVPTQEAVSYGINGALCVVSEPSTAIAAAEVAGILALLRSAYPGDNRNQLLARLFHTATGPAELPDHHGNMFTGHGVAQPLEALTRPMDPRRSGVVPGLSDRGERVGRVPVPEREPDLLAETRENAVWWGLLGTGALLVALLLSRLVRSSSRSERR